MGRDTDAEHQSPVAGGAAHAVPVLSLLACWRHEQENSEFDTEVEAIRAEGHRQQEEIGGQVLFMS